jgi:uncharacterized protein YbgA (DUF1722 family)
MCPEEYSHIARGRHTNVLQHLLGYFSENLDEAWRLALLNCMEDYPHGLVPLAVPVTLIADYICVFKVRYLRGRVELNPHPKEWGLRNLV